MMKRRLLLIAIASLASIATSTVPNWELEDNEALQPATLDTPTASVRYQIRAELHGPGPFKDLYGDIAAVVNLDPVVSTVAADLRSVTHPERGMSSDMTVVAPSSLFVELDAWNYCDADPCIEEYELTIRQDPTASPVAIVGVSGSISATASDSNERAPAGTEVILTVTGPIP